MPAHHLAVALETATSKHDGIRGQCFPRASLLYDKTGDAIILVGDLPRDAAVEKVDTGLLGRSRQLFDEDRPAADRLNASVGLSPDNSAVE